MLLFSGQNGDVRSPKRLCTDYRSVLVERNSFTSPVKDRLLAFSNLKKAPLQSAFARYRMVYVLGEVENLNYLQWLTSFSFGPFVL